VSAAKPRVSPRLTRRLGVYVVTGTDPTRGRTDRDAALAAIEDGADAVQLRGEGPPDDDLLALATELTSRCSWAGVLFIVDNRIEIALASGADGVHLGQADGFAQGRPG
jgi:thiamine-phosphate pyrophosphorylase